LCVKKFTSQIYAVKIFTKSSGPNEQSRIRNLEVETATLMGVNHPNILGLKGAFYEKNAVYLVLELAPEGDLFGWIDMKKKLTEAEARKVFIQLLEGLKYLVTRLRISIVLSLVTKLL
jgi:serine/threonine-protein kinase Chk2